MNNINEIEQKIIRLQMELEEAKRLQEEFNTMKFELRLAIMLHENTCTHNHTDGCDWFYEIRNNVHDWFRHEHDRYLVQATRIIEAFNADNIFDEGVITRLVNIITTRKY